MKITETADIVGYIWDLNGWNLNERTVKAWHDLIGDLDRDTAKAAVKMHYKTSTDRITPAHIRKACRPRVSGEVMW